MELEGNQTYFDELGMFVWNTCGQPFWTFGINNEKLDLVDEDTMLSLYNFMIEIYYATFHVLYHVEMMSHADMAVEEGMRDGNYTVDDFTV